MTEWDSYFDGVRQTPVTLAGKAVPIPAFYQAARGVTAVFPARIGRLRGLLPSHLQPSRLAPGVGMVAVSGFEYLESDIGPYEEMIFSIVVCAPSDHGNLPGQAVVRSLRRHQFHAHVTQLPVTTELAQALGSDLCGLPKTIEPVTVGRNERGTTFWLGPRNEPAVVLEAETLRGGSERRLSVFSHQLLGGRPATTEFAFLARSERHTTRPATARLRLDSGAAVTSMLSRVLLSSRSIHQQQLDGARGILFDARHREINRPPRG